MAKGTKETKAFERLVLGEDSESARVLKTLRQGRARIKKAWIQGSLATDKDGDDVMPLSEYAVGWCALGAVGARDEIKAGPAGRALEVVLDHAQFGNVFEFNDDGSTEKADVIDLFDKAIRHVKQHGVPTVQTIKKVRQQAT